MGGSRLSDNPVTDAAGHVDAALSVRELGNFGLDLGRQAAGGARPPVSGLPTTAGAFAGAMGTVLGPMSVGVGIDHLARGNYSQGALDIGAGGLGTASSLLGLAGRGGAALGPAAALASLGAYGNEQAAAAGAYGTDPGAGGGVPVHDTALPGQSDGDRPGAGRNLSFFESIGMRARSGFEAGRGAGGLALGAGAALATGADQTVRNSVEAVYAGGRRLFRGATGALANPTAPGAAPVPYGNPAGDLY